MPTEICLATTRVTARLVIRTIAPQWPLLVVLCPSDYSHHHAHTMLTPPPWIRHAPCNRQPYLIRLAA